MMRILYSRRQLVTRVTKQETSASEKAVLRRGRGAAEETFGAPAQRVGGAWEREKHKPGGPNGTAASRSQNVPS